MARPRHLAAALAARASCGTCQAFRVAGGDETGQGAYGECLWFNVPVDAAYTCDEWAPAVGLFSGPAVENAVAQFDKAKEREYQRAEDGKFGEGPGSGGKDKKEPAKEAPKEAPAGDPAAQEAAAVAAGLDPRDAAVLADPEAIAALPVEEAERLSAAGLLVRNEDGSYAPSELGAAVAEQIKAGDAEAAAESVEGAAEAFQAEQAETPPPPDPAAEATAPAGGAEPKPAGGGGGGGGGGEPFRPPSQDQMMETISSIPQAERDANREKIGEKLKLPPGFVAAVDEVKDPSEGIKMNPEASAQAQQMGLIRVNDTGVEELTDAGRLFVTAAAAGDAKSAELAVEQGGKEAPAAKAARPSIRKRAAAAPAPASPVHWSFAFAKVDGEQRIVEGYASSEALDSQPGVWKGQTYEGDVVDAASINAALPDYLQYANIREMHQPSAVGVALRAEVIPGEVSVTIDGRRRTLKNPLYLVVKVVDDAAWTKVKAGVYKGFSIGGAVVDAAVQRMGGRLVRMIKALQLTEISLVDRPANPDARIVVWKLAAGPAPATGGSMPPTPTTIPIDQEALARAVKDAMAGMAEPLAPLLAPLAKAAEPAKVISAIQALRNDAELAGDVEAAQMYTQAITLVMQAGGDAEGGEAEAEPDEIEVEAPAGDQMTEIAQGARATTLRKAGRVMARKRMDMMRPVVKSLLTLMADSGDAQAARALKAYGPGEDAPADALAGEDAGAAIGKALGVELATGLRPLAETVAKIQQDQASLADAMDALSRIARPGGPAARPVAVAKALATEPQREAVATEDVGELQRLASTEPDPKLRAYYQQRLYKATTHRP